MRRPSNAGERQSVLLHDCQTGMRIANVVDDRNPLMRGRHLTRFATIVRLKAGERVGFGVRHIMCIGVM